MADGICWVNLSFVAMGWAKAVVLWNVMFRRGKLSCDPLGSDKLRQLSYVAFRWGKLGCFGIC